MNLHIKTGLGIKDYVLDPNSNVEYEIFLTEFSWQISISKIDFGHFPLFEIIALFCFSLTIFFT